MHRSNKVLKSFREKRKRQIEKQRQVASLTFHTYPEERIHPCCKEIKYLEDEGCWICTSHTLKPTNDGEGYLMVHRQGRARSLHRYIWQLENERYLTSDEIIVMSCKCSGCINPAHMLVRRKGNFSGWANRKLKMRDASRIRQLHADGKTQKALAIRFGVSQGTISNIILGKYYKATSVAESPDAA
ncbi:MAG: hypothetical protein JXX14_02630 [Deltaproteobacteria bacterium]|nr:hypothetical protein [Deltaproteobacteria bacterium]